MVREAHIEPSTAELLREAVDEAKELVRLEVALAKDEARTELAEAKSGAIALGATAALAILGLALVLVALALAIGMTPLPAFIIGIVLLGCAGVAAYMASKLVPRRPLTE